MLANSNDKGLRKILWRFNVNYEAGICSNILLPSQSCSTSFSYVPLSLLYEKDQDLERIRRGRFSQT